MARLAFPLFALAIVGCTSSSPDKTSENAAQLAADPVALSGDFRFTGTVTPIARLTVNVVDDRQPDAATQVADLVAVGAVCQRAGNATRCSKMHPASEVAAESLARIATQRQGSFATFGALSGAPSVVTQGDSFTEWSVPQKVKTKDGEFDNYGWRDLDGDTQKLVVGPTELVFQDEGHLGLWTSSVTSEGRWRWHEDMAFAVLAK